MPHTFVSAGIFIFFHSQLLPSFCAELGAQREERDKQFQTGLCDIWREGFVQWLWGDNSGHGVPELPSCQPWHG